MSEEKQNDAFELPEEVLEEIVGGLSVVPSFESLVSRFRQLGLDEKTAVLAINNLFERRGLALSDDDRARQVGFGQEDILAGDPRTRWIRSTRCPSSKGSMSSSAR